MGKMKKKSGNKNSKIKIQNKKLNKSNRKKKKNVGKLSKKEINASRKGTNKSLLMQKLKKEQETNDLDNNGEANDEDVSPLDMLDEDGLETLKYYSNNYMKKSKRKLDPEEHDDMIERNYKNKYANNGETQRNRKQLLPIKGVNGLIEEQFLDKKYDDEIQENGDPNGKSDDVNDDEENIMNVAAATPKSAVEVLLERKMHMQTLKEKIGLLSRGVIENPQEEMKKLKELRTLLTSPEIFKQTIIKKLIIVSLTEIFKDITPGYKIRIWSEKENEQSISSDVKDVKEFEHTLVKQYKLFIDYLDTCVKTAEKLNKQNKESVKRQDISLGVLAVKCLCDLINKLSHFNYAIDIVELIVNQMASKIEEIASMCNQCIMQLMQNDNELELSLEIVRKVAKLLKQRSFGVKPEILNVFLSLNVKEIKVIEEDKKKLTHKEKMKLSRTDRKKLKQQEQLEQDLGEKKLADKLASKSKYQMQILEQVFFIYFNILKKTPNYKLIPSVLEGLSKFAHLINIDFFDDLISVMHAMIESDKLNYRSKLHCIKTVFIVLSGQGESLTIDPLRFYTSLYNILLQLNAAGNCDDTMLLAECFDLMFIKRRKQIPTPRLLAFIKRLSTITIQTEPKSCAILLNIMRQLISLNKSTDLLFDPEYQYSGVYNPELTEPEYANAQNTALWELHLLSRHCDQSIHEMSRDVLQQKPLTIHDTKQNIIQFFEQRDSEFEKLKSKKGQIK